MSTSVLPRRFKLSPVANYGAAILLAVAAVASAIAFDRFLGAGPLVSLFLCAIMFVAWANGTGPALLTTALTVLAFDWFFLPPIYSLHFSFADLPRLAVFVIGALFVVALSSAQRRAEESLRRAGDEQAGSVQELQRLNEELHHENAERKRAEERAGQAEQELRAAIDTIPALVASYGPDGSLRFVNKTGLDFSGLSDGDVKRNTWQIALYPDDLAAIQARWLTCIATGEPFEAELRLRRHDGEYRWVATRCVPLRDENGKVTKWYGAAFDIEDRKQAQRALQKSEADLAEAKRALQQTIDTIPVLVARYGTDGRRDFVNAAWQQYTGLSNEAALGTEWSITVHPEDIAEGERRWREALAKGESLHMEQRFRGADGQYRWHAVDRVALRDENGDVIKWYSSSHDIEDRKRAELALREREADLAEAQHELQLTLDRIPTLAWQTRSDGYAEYLNKRWLDYTGLPIERALGWEWQAAIHPADLPGLLDRWRNMLASGTAEEVEARMRRFDGEYRWFLFRPAPLRDEAGNVVRWYGTNTDIEDRKRTESALQRSEAYLSEAQKLSLTGTFGWKTLTGETYWSEETYKIMGFERRIKPSLDIVMQRTHPDDRAFVQNHIDRAVHGEKNFDYEHRLLMPDGRIKYLHILSHLVTDVSGAEEMIGAVMDVTQARQAQQALDAAQAELAHAGRVAVLGEMSASIAHEVNQPLAAIVANGEACLRFLAREEPDLNDVRGAVEWIVKDGNRAGEVIQRVRALTRKTDTHRAALDVNDAIDDVIILLQRELSANRISVQRHLAEGLPSVLADRVQLQQVIINLIMNAIEAMQGVVDRPRRLTIRSYQDDIGQVFVAVKDGGAGLTAESQNRLFDAFFSTKAGGLGMGLSICRSIIEAHGGRLSASANDDYGATFQFALPFAEVAA